MPCCIVRRVFWNRYLQGECLYFRADAPLVCVLCPMFVQKSIPPFNGEIVDSRLTKIKYPRWTNLDLNRKKGLDTKACRCRNKEEISEKAYDQLEKDSLRLATDRSRNETQESVVKYWACLAESWRGIFSPLWLFRTRWCVYWAERRDQTRIVGMSRNIVYFGEHHIWAQARCERKHWIYALPAYPVSVKKTFWDKG